MAYGLDELRLYKQLETFEKRADAKLLELQRWARCSFSLAVVHDGATDILTMKHCPVYSRSRLALPDYDIGTLHFVAQGDSVRSCSKSEIHRIGSNLQAILFEHETLPWNIADAEKWLSESFNGEGKSRVPVAISGMEYFHNIITKTGEPLAPPILHTYQTNDPESRKFLERLLL